MRFSANVFEAHWHRVARRGVNVAQEIAKRPGAHRDRIRKIQVQTYKAARIRKALKTEPDPAIRESLRQDLAKSKRKRGKHVRALCREVARSVRSSRYRFTLANGPAIGGKPTFTLVGDAPEAFFVSKTVQATIARAFQIHPTSRKVAVDLVTSVLSDRMPKTIVRLDLQSFYESVPHQRLLELLRRRDGLPSFTVDIVADLLRQYAVLTSQAPREARGLPRGVGLSAYLAEAYLTQLDAQLLELFPYATQVRYVDDVFVSIPDADASISAWRRLASINRVVASLELRIGRDPHRLLCEHLDVDPARPTKFGFLGYEFEYSRLPLVVRLSANRFDKIVKRTELAVDAYLRSGSLGGRSAQVLLNRIKFLSSNTRLVNSKSFAFVGIYFSNHQLNDIGQLRDLDVRLQRVLDRIPSGQLRDRLSNCSVEKGFCERTFLRLSPAELKVTTSVWK